MGSKLYHRRSLVETVISVLKRKYGAAVSSRGWWRQVRELVAMCLVYNVERAVQLGVSFLDWLWSWLLYFLQWRISTEPLYDKNDKLLKRFIANEVKVIQNIPTRTKSTAENLITKRKSTFELIDPKYDTRLPDELFDPKNLGK